MRIISGRARGLQLTTPKNAAVRPTADRVKESVFGIIGAKIIGARVLDLFAGTGNLGLESWSRGASAITFVDESQASLCLVRSNIAKCRADEACSVIRGSAVPEIARLFRRGQRFHFIFCDPPYGRGLLAQVMAALERYPLLADGGCLVAERACHDVLPLPGAAYTLWRSEKYGETMVDFIHYAEAEPSAEDA